jgi:zinc finger SWIM domain-containing protein 3
MFNSFSCLFLKGALGKATNQHQVEVVNGDSGHQEVLVKAANESEAARVEGELDVDRHCEDVAVPAPMLQSKADEISSFTVALKSDEGVKEDDLEEFRAASSTTDDVDAAFKCTSGSFVVGARFSSFSVAKEAAFKFARAPLVQKSIRDHKYVILRCFRAGQCLNKESKVDVSQQRKKLTRKCACPFEVRLKKIEAEAYVVYGVHGLHNHAMYSEDELASLPQNRYIPDEVKQKMLQLRSNGALTTNQIKCLIEQQFFPEIPVTWTGKDVVNLFQSATRTAGEATELIDHLQKLQSESGWRIALHVNPETFRLERVLWVSKQGLFLFQRYHEIIELDATYKTNRFGMPLVLVTGIDNNGITTLIAGCLLSDERGDSYLWCMKKLHDILMISPKVVFTDGDLEMARAIAHVWPNTLHFLCRFHIAQNVVKKLSGLLRSRLNEFMQDFWRVGSIEDVILYEREFALLKTKWPDCAHYLSTLQKKEKQWAFAYTHAHFVAGVASTQRQESINYQVKRDLISNSTLTQLLKGFESYENKIKKKIVEGSLRTKMVLRSEDPMINEAIKHITDYAGTLLREESTLSLAYVCADKSEKLYEVSHKDYLGTHRKVEILADDSIHCSCRLLIWKGIVCRHILCVLRRTNRLSCPAEWFHPMWRRDSYTPELPLPAMASFNFQPSSTPRLGSVQAVEDERLSRLNAVAKDLFLRSIGSDEYFSIVEMTLANLLSTVKKSQSLEQGRAEEAADADVPQVRTCVGVPELRNPLKVRTKGRPKTGGKRFQSLAETLRAKKKARGSVRCKRCGECGHNARSCTSVTVTL